MSVAVMSSIPAADLLRAPANELPVDISTDSRPAPSRERSLPPLPVQVQPSTSPVRKTSTQKSPAASTPAFSPKAAGKRRASPSSSHTAAREGLSKMMQDADVLAGFLPMLSWRTFHALASTCHKLRHLMDRMDLRDVILSHYVPGYRTCLVHASTGRTHAIDVDMHDLTLFSISQSTPLHCYPMHALSVISSSLYLPHIPPNDQRTLRYVALTHAHSRMVLLLQSLVHGGLSFLSDIDADDFSLLPPLGTPTPALPGVRELVFPKPLSFFEKPNANSNPSNQNGYTTPSSRTSNRRSMSVSRATIPSRTSSISQGPRASADFQSLMFRKSSSRKPLVPIVSVLGGGQKVPPPPPSENPPALSYYVGGWRRRLISHHSRSRSSSYPTSDEEEDFAPRDTLPRRRPFSVQHSSTESSLGSSSLSSLSGSNGNVDTDVSSESPKRESSSSPGSPPIVPLPRSGSNGSSPHDLSVATSRFRAPLLRVFVPCAQLDEIAVTACEEQLINAGLWEHLSEGDIICDFGFVPPPENEGSAHSGSSCSKSSGKTEREKPPHRRRWLMFNGYCLVHYIPPSPPPVQNALTLPSPFYYAHILPALSNTRFVLSMPPLSRSRDTSAHEPFASLTLSNVRTRVSSPHSPSGYAVVKKYLWLARIPYVGPASGTEARAALGEGWQGEWMLEAEGTQEGRQQLLDAVKADLNGATKRGLWEVVRDKSGGGRIWLRLITPNVDPRGLELNEQSQHQLERDHEARSQNHTDTTPSRRT